MKAGHGKFITMEEVMAKLNPEDYVAPI